MRSRAPGWGEETVVLGWAAFQTAPYVGVGAAVAMMVVPLLRGMWGLVKSLWK